MAAVSFRVPDETKNIAFEVIKSYGLSPTQALNMFLAQIAKTKAIPVSLDYQTEQMPNSKTIMAMAELDNHHGREYKTLEEFHQAMLAEMKS
ncbi:type II toxin-antitoxin system RelB/DinJ family antitoxin [Haemophilus haemolyticus]|uniref:type II toxin-antitoxin system RelB/DinJ family antitoxin n=1 Tax=Haemophilus haemolyticus TaxID=726 RepID=UPI0008039CA1|nr:type II toxin-antitoxin system RelB/DinJ family antitoxin [Haemophilus haemolyticus]OBX88781.1 translation repressor RelB [Haemophilus haemolyticus]